jgi:arsenate reductase
VIPFIFVLQIIIMKKAYYLSTCSTCQKVLDQIKAPESFQMQDIKTSSITTEQIEEMKMLSGSYKSLFSKRAMKYRSLGLNDQNLGEEAYKKWILEEYTFLKRPVFIVKDKIFIGNSKKEIAAFLSEIQ